jgi:cytochrome P450
VTVIDVDLFQPDSWADGVPHAVFDKLRAEDPVHWCEETPVPVFDAPAGPGYWAVTRYDDVVEVSRHPDVFSSHRGGTQIFDPPTAEDLAIQQQMLINMDPPEHSTLRKIVSGAFTPRAVATLREQIEAHARSIVDAVADRGDQEFDFVPAVAAELPLLVLADVLGVPRADRHLLFDWSNRLIGALDPEYGGGIEDFQAAFMEMFAYGHGLAEEKRAHPTDDVISTIVNAEVDGERLDEIELDMFWELLVIAGNETTRNLVSGGLQALSEHPAEKARLLADLAGLPVAIEEMLRYVTPVVHFRRTATRGTALAGRPIEEGQKVVVYYVSANRDEAVFDEPHRFDVARSPNSHLAFGNGPHFCLGASLARLEIRVLFEELLTRVPGIEVCGPVQRMHSSFINGVKHLPVRVC